MRIDRYASFLSSTQARRKNWAETPELEVKKGKGNGRCPAGSWLPRDHRPTGTRSRASCAVAWRARQRQRRAVPRYRCDARRRRRSGRWPTNTAGHRGTERDRQGKGRVAGEGEQRQPTSPRDRPGGQPKQCDAEGKGLHRDAKGRAGQPRRATTPSGDRAQEPANPTPHASTVFKALKNSNSVTTYPEPTSLHSRRLSRLPTRANPPQQHLADIANNRAQHDKVRLLKRRGNLSPKLRCEFTFRVTGKTS
jgi:hypothetical protein